jgi:hypothetical protein
MKQGWTVQISLILFHCSQIHSNVVQFKLYGTAVEKPYLIPILYTYLFMYNLIDFWAMVKILA